MVTLVSLTLIPTMIYAVIKMEKGNNEHIFMFLIMQMGIIITVIADLSRTNSDIQAHCKDNEHAKFLIKTLLCNYKLVHLDNQA
jgi:hypothetical protein